LDFQLINAMYEYRSLSITTNKDFTSWGEFFFDDSVATPVVDRIIHHSHIFMLGGESYRLKSKLELVQYAFCKSENLFWQRRGHRADFGFSTN